MSYILDALRKSETERRQGKIPDLGQQVQLIHKPKKKGVSPVLWLSLALLVNAAILAAVFWKRPLPEAAETAAPENAVASSKQQADHRPVDSTATEAPSQSVDQAVSSNGTDIGKAFQSEENESADESADKTQMNAVAEAKVAPERKERPVIITPSVRTDRPAETSDESDPVGRVPHLVELPLSFQRSVPNLTFNSHIYSSDPFASRVMINSQYLRRGDSFSGLVVEDITEEGVILSKQGQWFRVGIVRDWVSPR